MSHEEGDIDLFVAGQGDGNVRMSGAQKEGRTPKGGAFRGRKLNWVMECEIERQLAALASLDEIKR